MPAILAYFSQLEEAQRAKEILAEYGINRATIDRVGRYEYNYTRGDDINPTKPERMTGLSNMVQGTDYYEGAGILASANPAASGMSAPKDMLQDKHFLLTVVCEARVYDIVRELVEELGGFLGS